MPALLLLRPIRYAKPDLNNMGPNHSIIDFIKSFTLHYLKLVDFPKFDFNLLHNELTSLFPYLHYQDLDQNCCRIIRKKRQ